jgi:hypothetical protein
LPASALDLQQRRLARRQRDSTQQSDAPHAKKRGSRNARPAPEFHTIETIRDFSRDMQHLCNRDAAKYHK